jgi:hypothetical protein
MFTGVNILLAAFVWYCVPETKGVPLEEMDVLFGGANHVVAGAELIEMGKAGGGEERGGAGMGRESEADAGLALGGPRVEAAERGGAPPRA